MNGFKVSDTAYFVYANGDKEKDEFGDCLHFDTRLIPYTGNADWVERVIFDIKKCLNSDVVPESGEECDYCAYRGAINSIK